jgi:hypothetical protein
MKVKKIGFIHMGVRIYCTPSPLRYALTIKTGWKWNYDVVGV